MINVLEVHQQFMRYVVIGITSNAVTYFLYLLLTSLGVGPKTAMTSLYLLGVLQTFVFNSRWTFRFEGAAAPALIRYAAAYTIGYIVNLVALLLLVDHIGLPHQWVQGAMTLVVAAILFIAQKYWVFRQLTRSDTA